MPQPLHPKANLEILKKQAKEILKAHKSADGSQELGAGAVYACQILRSLHRFAGRPDFEILEADIKLTDVQYAIALRYGFESWQKLKQHVESAHNIYKETKIELTGIQIFRLLPKTNCQECGVPTCLAFAMNLASGKAELDSCPYVSDEAREQLKETKMELTGIQIFRLLPKTNCQECGVPTCLAFAMNLESGKAELDSCPYVSDEARERLTKASAPPIRLVM